MLLAVTALFLCPDRGTDPCPESHVHRFPGQRNTFKRQSFRIAYFRSFST